MKKNKKFNPVYTVDITKCDTEFDIKVAIALAKHNAGLAMSDEDLYAICDLVAELAADTTESIMRKNVEFAAMLISDICTPCNLCAKKKPWYKRFWNWLTGRK